MKIWSHPPGLNRRPTDYESVALPAELGWPSGLELKCGARLFAYSSAIITHGDPPPRRRADSPRDARRLPHSRAFRRHRSRPIRARPRRHHRARRHRSRPHYGPRPFTPSFRPPPTRFSSRSTGPPRPDRLVRRRTARHCPRRCPRRHSDCTRYRPLRRAQPDRGRHRRAPTRENPRTRRIGRRAAPIWIALRGGVALPWRATWPM